ncbi:hypothetical protein BVY03_01960 [bacterium K02(2017)]|nr:hypothetical protein BVY03_01960 [bacterium K02(2017)]
MSFKKLGLLFLILHVLVLLPYLGESRSPIQSQKRPVPHQINQDQNLGDSRADELQAKSMGQKMVEFIRQILGDKPKPINEKLIRDEE